MKPELLLMHSGGVLMIAEKETVLDQEDMVHRFVQPRVVLKKLVGEDEECLSIWHASSYSPKEWLCRALGKIVHVTVALRHAC